jgi:multidrug efflux pump subunit AcrA (membrane-fusion protein)
MVAAVAVRTGGRRPAVAVPAAAVARDADGATLVYVPAPPDARGVARVRARRVEVGAALGDRVEVARGLAAGEPVVVAGQERLRDGARVTAVAAPVAAPPGAPTAPNAVTGAAGARP